MQAINKSLLINYLTPKKRKSKLWKRKPCSESTFSTCLIRLPNLGPLFIGKAESIIIICLRCMVGVESQLARMGPCSPYTLVWDPARQGRTLLKFYILERTKHYKYFIIIFQGPTQVSRVHPWRIGPHPGERGPIPSIRIFPDWSYLGN